MKRFFLTLLFIFFILIALKAVYPFIRSPEPTRYSTAVPHFYQNPAVSIGQIRLRVWYVVPKNRIEKIDKGWQDLVKPILEEVVQFHDLQFRGLSKLVYEIYPEPFILEKDNLFYDTDSTQHGNPQALRHIIAELEARKPNLLQASSDEFLSTAFVYEGVGASGTAGAMILSRTFLADASYRLFRSSLFYHEFGHTLGLPDQYDLATNRPYTDDLMGRGRRFPLDINYLNPQLLKGMGVGI